MTGAFLVLGGLVDVFPLEKKEREASEKEEREREMKREREER